MSRKTDWFCKCCKDFYKRESPTMLRDGSKDQMCYEVTGMCSKCFKESNDGHEFGEASEELLAVEEEIELSPEEQERRERMIQEILNGTRKL